MDIKFCTACGSPTEQKFPAHPLQICDIILTKLELNFVFRAGQK